MKKEPKIDLSRGARIREVREQVLRVDSQEDLSATLGVSRGAVGNWEQGKGVKMENLSKLANLANVRLEWLAYGSGDRSVTAPTQPEAPVPKRPQPNASFPPRWQAFPGDVSIPLRGQISAGPNGRFIMNGQDIARVFCPPGLEDVEGAYAVQIQGTSGEPRFYNGETAWANPHARYRKGDDVIVQILGDFEDDEVSSYIKRFESQSGDVLRLYQYNPGPDETHELEFPASKVFSIHKVVFHAML